MTTSIWSLKAQQKSSLKCRYFLHLVYFFIGIIKIMFAYKHLQLWLGFCIILCLTISEDLNVYFKTQLGFMGLRLRNIA